MGKQFSIYLDEKETKRLAQIAQQECRRPTDQVRFMLRSALGLSEEQNMESFQEKHNRASQVLPDSSAVAV